MTDLGRVGGPYIRLTLLWTRSTITILSKASKALHHPLSRKTIIHVPRVPSGRKSVAAIVPPPGSGAKGSPLYGGTMDRGCPLWVVFVVAMSTSNGRSLLLLLPHQRRCWPTRSASTRRATPSATEHHPG